MMPFLSGVAVGVVLSLIALLTLFMWASEKEAINRHHHFGDDPR